MSALKTSYRLLVYFLTFFISSVCFAGWEILPESQQHLYSAWGLFVDQHSSMVNYGQGRLWTALGGPISLFGNSESPHHPTFNVTAFANASIHYNSNYRLWTDTVDAQVSFGFQWEFTPSLRIYVSYLHFSGHTVDGLPAADSSLNELTLGQELLPIRLIYDMDRLIRVGVTLKPVLRSYPEVQRFWADEFFEVHPWGGKDDPHSPSPYFALSLGQSGTDYYLWTFHSQLGIYFGNHFTPSKHQQTLRLVLGYYTGPDPRLKYFEFRNKLQHFGYLGVMVDI